MDKTTLGECVKTTSTLFSAFQKGWKNTGKKCSNFNPIGCRGEAEPAPPLKEKVAHFVTFPKYVNGVLETTFYSQVTFGQAGREQKWSKLA